jgi:hypothetical protein
MAYCGSAGRAMRRRRQQAKRMSIEIPEDLPLRPYAAPEDSMNFASSFTFNNTVTSAIEALNPPQYGGMVDDHMSGSDSPASTSFLTREGDLDQDVSAYGSLAAATSQWEMPQPVEDCTAYSLFLKARGDPDNASSRVTAGALWRALEPHVLASQQSRPNMNKRRHRRAWQRAVLRAASTRGASYQAFFDVMASMDLVPAQAAGMPSDVNTAAEHPLRVPVVVARSLPCAQPDNITPPCTPTPTATARMAFSGSFTRSAKADPADRSARLARIMYDHHNISARFAAPSLVATELSPGHSPSPAGRIPPELVHLVRLNTGKLSAFLVRHQTIGGPWMRCIRRANDMVSALSAVAARSGSFTASPPRIGAGPDRSHRVHHRTPRLEPSPPRRDDTTTARRSDAAGTSEPRSSPRNAKPDKPPPFVPGGAGRGALNRDGSPRLSLRSPRCKRRTGTQPQGPGYMPVPDVSDYVAHVHRRAVREGLV